VKYRNKSKDKAHHWKWH